VLPVRDNRDFMWLWGAEAVSELGTSMSLLVFPLIGYAVSGSTREAGLATTGVLLGELVALLPAGVVVDRSSRRRVLIVADLVGAAAFAALAATALLDVLSIWLLLVMGIVSGAASAFGGPANAAALRAVVEKERLPEALAQTQARSSAARLAGPPLGGALYSLSRSLPFVIDAVSYMYAAVAVTRVRHRLPAPDHGGAGTPPPLRTLGDGLRFVLRTPVPRVMMTWAALANLSGAFLGVVVNLRLLRAGVPPAAIGAVDTIAAVAGLLGAFVAPVLVRRSRTGLLAVATGVVSSAGFAFTALTTNFLVVGLLWALGALLIPANNAGISAYMTAVVPEAMQGRFFAALGFVSGGVAPLGPVLAGIFLADIGGVGATVVGALVGVLAVVPLLINRRTRTLGRPDTWDTAPESEEERQPSVP
jgi:MFS family permease